MAVRTISTKLAVEGEAEYRKSISACNTELSTMKSTLKLVESEFRGQSNSLEALTTKGEALSSMYDKQKEKIATLEAALTNASSAQEKYSERISAAKENIERCEKSLSELKNSTEDTSEEQEALTKELDQWNKELSESQAGQVAAARGVNNWQKQLNNAKVDLNKLSDEVQQNNTYLKEAQKSADGAATSIDEYGKKTKEAGDSIDTLAAALAAAGVAGTIKEIAAALRDCVSASVEFESAITGVFKTVDGTDEQLQAISDAVKKISLEIPASTTEIASVAEAAGQLGIKTDDVMSFTETMINLGVATNLTADEAATMLAKFANITGLDPSKYNALGSSIVALGNNSATTERDIVAMATRLASAGTLAGLTETEIIALASSMSSVGIEAEAGGTAMSQTLAAMEKAVVMGGEQLGKFAKVAGMSAAEFADKWKSTPIEAIRAFTAGLGGLESQGESAVLVLDDMGLSGVRQSNMLQSLALASKTMNGAIELSNDAWQKNTALADEASKRYATTESQMILFNNALNLVKVSIGDQLTPTLNGLAAAGTKSFEWAAQFIQEHPEIVSLLTGVVTAITALTLGITAYTVAVQIAIPLMKAFAASAAATPIGIAAVAIGLLTSAVISFASASANADDETKKLTESINHSKQAYEDTAASIATENENTNNLVSALETALASEEKSAAQKAAILEIIDQLNEALPDLGLSYDETTDSINMTTESLEAMAEASASHAENDAAVERLSTLYSEQAEIASQLQAAQEELSAAQEAGKSVTDEYTFAMDGSSSAAWDVYAATSEAQRKIDDLTAAQSANAAEIEQLDSKVSAYIETTKANAQATAEMETRIDSVTTQMKSLQAEYEEAQKKALESINQQIGLFANLDGSAKTSIDNLISTLAGQVKYMDTYAANINKAMELGVDQGIVQKLSDGSQESAQILSAIVAGGEEKIAELNKNFEKVEEGKQTLSNTVAEMETDFKHKMGLLVTDLDSAIQQMDVADDAYVIGTDNIQGLINGAASKRKELIDTYTKMAKDALAAYKRVMNQHSPSKAMAEVGGNDVKGLIVGAEREQVNLEKTYAELAGSALKAMEKALPSSYEEPSAVMRQEAQTAAIVKAIQSSGKTSGGIVVNNYSPEALDEKTSAREFKKTQRDLSLDVS